MKIKFLLIGTSLSLIPTLTYAQCVATQDCKTLGYTETSCNGGKGVKCPFGNWWACLTSEEECLNLACDKLGFTYTCTGTGEKGVGNDCNGKYQGCSCDSKYQYTCSGTGYSGGSGSACGGKYTACTCTSGYEWKNGSCQQLNGAQGELYYCNGTVVGIRATGMDFYVAMNDLGYLKFEQANNQCQSYAFCGSVKGTIPSSTQLTSIYSNKSQINSLLSTHGGTQLRNTYYWSGSYTSTYKSYYAVSMSNGKISWQTSGTDRHAHPILTSW